MERLLFAQHWSSTENTMSFRKKYTCFALQNDEKDFKLKGSSDRGSISLTSVKPHCFTFNNDTAQVDTFLP